MKLRGKESSGPATKVVVIPRDEGDDLVFKVQAVLNYADFEALNPMPKPPVLTFAGGAKREDTTDPDFQEAVLKRVTQRFYWMYIKSLEATADLEWTTVKLNEPDTWANFEKELLEWITEYELRVIKDKVMEVNGLNEDKITEATNSFLARLEAAQSK